MKILILSAILSSYVAIAQPNELPECERYNSLSEDQQTVLYEAWLYGLQHDYAWTLPAIAWAESNAGMWRLNYFSHDFGVMQINIETASRMLGVTSRFKKIELAQQLVDDNELNYYLGSRVLKHFQRGRVMTNDVWIEMVKSYNEGYRWRSDEQSAIKAQGYYETVAQNVRELRLCANFVEPVPYKPPIYFQILVDLWSCG